MRQKLRVLSETPKITLHDYMKCYNLVYTARDYIIMINESEGEDPISRFC